jgi:hypothetical protein
MEAAMSVTEVAYDQVKIEIGDGASPEVFAQPCLINTDKGVQFSAAFSDDVIPQCGEDEDKPARVIRNVDNVSFTVTGSGKLHTGDVKTYVDWLASGEAKNCRIRIGASGASGATQIVCPVRLTELNPTATRPNTADVTLTLVSDGFVATQVAAYT